MPHFCKGYSLAMRPTHPLLCMHVTSYTPHFPSHLPTPHGATCQDPAASSFRGIWPKMCKQRAAMPPHVLLCKAYHDHFINERMQHTLEPTQHTTAKHKQELPPKGWLQQEETTPASQNAAPLHMLSLNCQTRAAAAAIERVHQPPHSQSTIAFPALCHTTTAAAAAVMPSALRRTLLVFFAICPTSELGSLKEASSANQHAVLALAVHTWCGHVL